MTTYAFCGIRKAREWGFRMDAETAKVLAAIGPRLRSIREVRGRSLANVAEASGLSLSVLSRVETGHRQPTLDVLIPLAREYRIALEAIIAAPATGDPRLHLEPRRHAGGGVIVPLTRYPARVNAFKHVLGPREPRLVSHPGHAWLYVLNGTLRLIVGADDLTLSPGETAEFDATTPHWFGPEDGTSVEILHLFGPNGDQAVPRLEHRLI
ncbi:transcriptional regulator, XRE family with cupin sensor [Streptomyces zhaozhouensis]|uniref:Transcriptional regulator, XRE family with cupin sensor n=1 Tax=Streptomyces zhaozhouensis TaxID=1300267 RepID=A0A286DVY1_9ACTN|nr:XRE family transcriptional regulator [Streptomyces zhaozhouensis]SOD62770.1 transcriptional regulator, XRE family with cupin sensor [Streptomyces zhaozhouensis]